MGEVAKVEVKGLRLPLFLTDDTGAEHMEANLQGTGETITVAQRDLQEAWAEGDGFYMFREKGEGGPVYSLRIDRGGLRRRFVEFVNDYLGPVVPMRFMIAHGCRLSSYDQTALLFDVGATAPIAVMRESSAVFHRRAGELRVMTPAVDRRHNPTLITLRDTNESASTMARFFGAAKVLDEVKFTTDGIGGQHAEGTFNGERVRFSREAVARGGPQGDAWWVEVRARAGLESYLLPNTGDAVRFLFGTPAIPDEEAAPKAEPKSFAFDAKEGYAKEGYEKEEPGRLTTSVDRTGTRVVFARQYWVDGQSLRVKDGDEVFECTRAQVSFGERVGDHIELLVESRTDGEATTWTRVRFPGIDAKVIEFANSPHYPEAETPDETQAFKGVEDLRVPRAYIARRTRLGSTWATVDWGGEYLLQLDSTLLERAAWISEELSLFARFTSPTGSVEVTWPSPSEEVLTWVGRDKIEGYKEAWKVPQEETVHLIGDRSDIRVAAGWIQTNEWACRVSNVTGVRIDDPRSSGLRSMHLYAGACVEAYTVDDLRPEHVAAILDAVTGGVA